MIGNSPELQIALQSLCISEETLAALREELAEVNPDLLAAAMPADSNRTALLQSEISEYLYAHPSDVSKLAADTPLKVPTL